MRIGARQVDPEAWFVVVIALLPGVVAVLYSIAAPDYGPVGRVSLSISLLSFVAAFFCISQFWDDLFGTGKQVRPSKKKYAVKTG